MSERRWEFWIQAPCQRSVEKRAYGENDPWYARLSRKAWGGIGAASGLGKAIYDKLSGQSIGTWRDYIRTGYHVGHDNADRLATGVIEGAAKALPFVDTKKISDIVDHSYSLDNTGYRNLSDDASAAMSAGSQYAGALASLAAQAPAYAKIFGLANGMLGYLGRAGFSQAANGSSLSSRLFGAATASGAADATSKLYGLDDPYHKIVKPVGDIASGFGDWARIAFRH